jgi:hypothetical protein
VEIERKPSPRSNRERLNTETTDTSSDVRSLRIRFADMDDRADEVYRYTMMAVDFDNDDVMEQEGEVLCPVVFIDTGDNVNTIQRATLEKLQE